MAPVPTSRYQVPQLGANVPGNGLESWKEPSSKALGKAVAMQERPVSGSEAHSAGVKHEANAGKDDQDQVLQYLLVVPDGASLVGGHLATTVAA